MTVTQRLMKPGSFRVELIEDYPTSVAQAVAEFDHIVITPTRLQPIEGFSDANILDQALFTGTIYEKPSPRIFGGYGLEAWLGTPDGLGDLLDTAVTKVSASLSSWVTDLRPSSLSAGTVTTTGLSNVSGKYQWMTRREALDSVCRLAGAEWRVNPDFTLDAADPDLLFAADPTVVITRREEGPDGEFRGLEGSLIVQASDVKQYTTKAFAVTQGADLAGTVASSTGSTSYVDGLNNALVMERVVDGSSLDPAARTALASSFVAQYNKVRRELSLNSRTYSVGRFVKPGDTVYVYDQLAQLTDAANQIVYRGEVTTPIAMRVFALTWPIERGMGVYARRSGPTPTYTDLTDFVRWEDGSDVVWEVGAGRRPLTGAGDAIGSGAYLGSNAAVADSAARRGSYTPTLSGAVIGTGGSAANSARWTIVDDMMFVEGRVVFGTSGRTFPGATVTVTLPSGFEMVDAGQFLPVGQCSFRDDDAALTSPGVVRPQSSTTLRFLAVNAAGTYLSTAATSTTVPFSWDSSDGIYWSASFRVKAA